MTDDLRCFAASAGAAQELVNGAGLAALSTIPIAGPFLANATQSAMAIRENARRAEFDRLVIERLERISADVAGITPESIISSDDFAAAYAKSSRVASETASKRKREYLARALGQMGPWNDIDVSRKHLLLDLVARYEELHIRLLDYFRAPILWIKKGTPQFQVDGGGIGGVSGPIGTYMFPGVPDWDATVVPALKTLENDSLANVPWTTTMSTEGTFQSRTTPLGDALLAFIDVKPGDTDGDS